MHPGTLALSWIEHSHSSSPTLPRHHLTSQPHTHTHTCILAYKNTHTLYCISNVLMQNGRHYKCISAPSKAKAHYSQMEKNTVEQMKMKVWKTPPPSALLPAGLHLLFCALLIFLSAFFSSHLMQSHYAMFPCPPPLFIFPLCFVLIPHPLPFLLYLSLLFYSLCFFPFCPFILILCNTLTCFSLCLSPLLVNRSWLGAERPKRSSPVDQCL